MFFIHSQYSITIYYFFDTISFILFPAYIYHIYIVYSRDVSGSFFFISLFFLNTLFIETNSSWLIYESIKAVEIETLITFNLAFPCNTIGSCFLFFFLINDMSVLIPVVITQILLLLHNLQYTYEYQLIKKMQK